MAPARVLAAVAVLRCPGEPAMRSRFLDILIWVTVLALVAGFGMRMLRTGPMPQEAPRFYRD